MAILLFYTASDERVGGPSFLDGRGVAPSLYSDPFQTMGTRTSASAEGVCRSLTTQFGGRGL
jgi:hypothetical protein